MSNEESPAVRAGHAYFKGKEEPSANGSAMDVIGAERSAQAEKSARLKAAREERDAAQAVVDAAARAQPPVRKSHKKTAAD